jgi:hypothetical protein
MIFRAYNKDKKMATKTAPVEMKKQGPTGETKETKKVELIKSTTLKPKQKFVDLDSGEEKEIVVESERYELVPFSGDVAKHFSGDKNAYYHEAFKQASQMVQPVTEQVEAFIKYATSASYQDGKKAALSGGNFLSPELKSKISAYMGNLTAFSELKASERFDKWLSGYKEKKPGAMKILDAVSQSEDVFSDLL